jgi:hypothetical protein
VGRPRDLIEAKDRLLGDGVGGVDAVKNAKREKFRARAGTIWDGDQSLRSPWMNELNLNPFPITHLNPSQLTNDDEESNSQGETPPTASQL